jgi:hypothetical protein
MKSPLKAYQKNQVFRGELHQFFFILHEITLKRACKYPDSDFVNDHGRDIR